MTLDLEKFCLEQLGSELTTVHFRAGFLNNVYGVELTDGRSLVIKEHPVSDGLEAVVRARSRLAEADVGCPPVVDLIDDRIVVEPLVRGGHIPDGHSADGITAMATLLARIIEVGAPAVGLVGVPWTDYRHGLYPQPPGGPVDFGDATGVEWADELATEAADRLCSATGPVVVGHGDFQAQNTRFDGPRLIAVFDWDSLIADREAAVVGFAAAMFVDVGDPARPECATPGERRSFIEAYEGAAGRALDRRLVDAASVWLMAYMGRCVNAWFPADPPYYEGTHLGTLYRYGAGYLEGRL